MDGRPVNQEHPYRLWYLKDEVLRFVGHLDTVKLVERALRKADLPLVFTEGYSRKPKLITCPPLPVGFTSRMELLDFALTEPLGTGDLLQKLQEASEPRELFHKLRPLGPSELRLNRVVHSALLELVFLNKEKQEFLTEEAFAEFLRRDTGAEKELARGLLGWGVSNGRLRINAGVRISVLPLAKLTKAVAAHFHADFAGGERVMLLREDGGLAF